MGSQARVYAHLGEEGQHRLGEVPVAANNHACASARKVAYRPQCIVAAVKVLPGRKKIVFPPFYNGIGTPRMIGAQDLEAQGILATQDSASDASSSERDE